MIFTVKEATLRPPWRRGRRGRNLWCGTFSGFFYWIRLDPSLTGDAWWLRRFQWWLSWVSVVPAQTLHVSSAAHSNDDDLWSSTNAVIATPKVKSRHFAYRQASFLEEYQHVLHEQSIFSTRIWMLDNYTSALCMNMLLLHRMIS